MLNYIALLCTHLRWCFNFLLHHSFSKYLDQCVDFPPFHDHQATQIFSSLNIVHYKPEGESSTVECAVCLCKIDGGEEIRELRCGHFFHKVCLDRWTGYKHAATCPLCRRRLAPPRSTQGCHGRYPNQLDEPEVLLFGFCSLGSGSDPRDRWWLR